MKTYNVFTSNSDQVVMQVFGSMEVDGDIKKDPKNILIEKTFVLTEEMQNPLLTNKEGEYMSLAAYGLARLMQDRCSAFTDKFYGADGYTDDSAALDRVGEYEKVYELLEGGRFNVERESAGKKKTISASIIRAFRNYCVANDKHLTDLQAQTILGKLPSEKLEAVKKMLKDSGLIKIALDQIKSEREEAIADLEDLDLSELFA